METSNLNTWPTEVLEQLVATIDNELKEIASDIDARTELIEDSDTDTSHSLLIRWKDQRGQLWKRSENLISAKVALLTALRSRKEEEKVSMN
jgi:hypothetical protein